MSDTIEYITNPGDRWDLIAYKAYGTCGNITLDDGTLVNAISYIMAANPDIVFADVLDPSLLLQIPVVVNLATNLDSQSLPPWKQ